ESWYRKAVELAPGDPEACIGLCRALEMHPDKQKEAREYRETYEREIAPVAKELRKLLAAGRTESLRANPDAACQVAELFLKLGNEAQALRWLQTALERNPNHRQANLGMAEYFERKKDLDNAQIYRLKAAGAVKAAAP